MMLASIMDTRGQLDYSYRGRQADDDSSTENVKEHHLDALELGTVFQQRLSVSSNENTSRRSSHSIPSQLPESVSRYAEPGTIDSINPSYGPYFGQYSSRASSTLPSPTPMTPNTEDLVHQWTSRRRPSDIGASSATPSFSPQSPRDYDFPTGNYLQSPAHASQSSTPHADLFPEDYHRNPTYLLSDHGPLTVNTNSTCIAMGGPPYPAQILDHNGEIIPEAYVDPHVINMGVDGQAFTTPEDLLNMDYGAELHVPLLRGFPDNALTPVQEDDYADPNDQDRDYSPNHPFPESQRAPPHTSGISSSEALSSRPGGQAQPPQRPLNRRQANPIRPRLKSPNTCPTCNKPFETPTKLRKHNRKEHIRPYPCIFTHYGCASVFGTKNEWSRHVKVQHLRLETWKCQLDDCERHNDAHDEAHLLLPAASKGKCEYDRKDLFLNHVRRCHKNRYPRPGVVEGSEAMAFEDKVQLQCHLTLRTAPTQSLCPCCPTMVWSDFDARLEHIGRAMESNEEARVSFHDPMLENYLVNEALLQWRDPVGWLLTGAEGKKGGRQARRGTQQRPLTTHAPLHAADDEVEPQRATRKSKRVELKKKQRRRQKEQEEAEEEEEEEEEEEQEEETDDDAEGEEED